MLHFRSQTPLSSLDQHHLQMLIVYGGLRFTILSMFNPAYSEFRLDIFADNTLLYYIQETSVILGGEGSNLKKAPEYNMNPIPWCLV